MPLFDGFKRAAVDALCAVHSRHPEMTMRALDTLTKTSTRSPTAPPSLAETVMALPSYLSIGVGLLAIADVNTAARKLAAHGHVSMLDPLLYCFGMHKDLTAPQLAHGEHPACAAMTTGYVFRVENEATVHYFQNVGKTGVLTTVEVRAQRAEDESYSIYHLCVLLTLTLFSASVYRHDWDLVLGMLLYMLARTVNTLILKDRSRTTWKGNPEPGARSDLLVLMAQDKWIRVRGATDDVKAITAGSWLDQPTKVQQLASTLSTILLYLSIGPIYYASAEGRWALLMLMSFTTVVMEIDMMSRTSLCMHDRVIKLRSFQDYGRRLDMIKDLLKEVDRDDWCEKMGIILESTKSPFRPRGAATM